MSCIPARSPGGLNIGVSRNCQRLITVEGCNLSQLELFLKLRSTSKIDQFLTEQCICHRNTCRTPRSVEFLLDDTFKLQISLNELFQCKFKNDSFSTDYPAIRAHKLSYALPAATESLRPVNSSQVPNQLVNFKFIFAGSSAYIVSHRCRRPTCSVVGDTIAVHNEIRNLLSTPQIGKA